MRLGSAASQPLILNLPTERLSFLTIVAVPTILNALAAAGAFAGSFARPRERRWYERLLIGAIVVVLAVLATSAALWPP